METPPKILWIQPLGVVFEAWRELAKAALETESALDIEVCYPGTTGEMLERSNGFDAVFLVAAPEVDRYAFAQQAGRPVFVPHRVRRENPRGSRHKTSEVLVGYERL